MELIKMLLRDGKAALLWLEKALILLGMVFVYQYVQVNFRGKGVSYNTAVLEAYAQEAVVEALNQPVRGK